MSDRLTPLNHSAQLAVASALLRSPAFLAESTALRACAVLKRHGDWMDREQARHIELVLGVPPRPFKAPQEGVNARQAAEEASDHGMMRRGAAVAAGLLLLSALIIFETLLHKSGGGRGSPFPGRSYPTASVTGMPSAVYPFSTAMRTWSSAT